MSLRYNYKELTANYQVLKEDGLMRVTVDAILVNLPIYDNLNIKDIKSYYFIAEESFQLISIDTMILSINGTNTYTVPIGKTIKATLMSGDPTLAVGQWSIIEYDVTSAAGGGITALTGDVTATGPGSVVATIANDAVTYAKIQNVTTNRLLGRATAGAGDTEEITLGTNLSFTGTTLNAASTATSPGGSGGDIQYNNGGAFGGITGFAFDGTFILIRDSIFQISDNVTPSKILMFELAGLTAATTRTITMVDFSGVQVLSNGSLTSTRVPFSGTAGLQDLNNFVFQTPATLTAGALGIGVGSTAISTLMLGQTAATSGSPGVLLAVPANHTGLTASTDIPDVEFRLARTVQFALGSKTLQRAYVISNPTYSATGATTTTDAVTFEVSGSPVAGTNMTITRSWAARILGNTAIGTKLYIGSATGVVLPTALLHLAAGTTAATTAPLKFTSGTSMTTAEPGAVEMTTDDLFFTITTGAARKRLVLADPVGGLTSGRVSFTTTNGRQTDVSTFLFVNTAGGRLSVGTTTATANLNVGGGATVGGSNLLALFTGAAHTNQTAGTELVDFNVNLARTLQFATGAIATQRAFLIQAPTYSFVGASTITDAVTLGVTGPPVAGTNATITRAWAARILGKVATGLIFAGDNTGTTDPTACVHAAASTTTIASIRMQAGTAPTSPKEGDEWNDSTQKALSTFYSGITRNLVGCIFTQTADQTVTNTTTETTLLGTGVGTKTLPSNFFTIGKTIRLRVGGVYSTPITGATATIRVKYGSTTLATIATTSLLASASNLEVDGEVLITCRTTGGTGTVITHGDIEYLTGVTGTIAVDPLNNAGATTTIDTTTTNALDVTIQWDTADAAKIAKSTACFIEVLN